MVLGIVGLCAAQETATAYRATSIVVDGYLDEPVWKHAKKIEIKHDIGMMLTDGSVVSHDDASTEFVLLWDDEGFYCGTWNKDDIHNAPWTEQPGMVYQSWKDDGHEWWISRDFNDVWEDASPLYYGTTGWQIWKGWVWENAAPKDLHIAYRNDDPPISTTTFALRQKGFWGPYTSVDGIDFTTESQWSWSGFFLGSIGTPSAGKELGFNLGLTDNDGGDMAAAWLRWATGNCCTYQGWGKVTLSDEPAGIARTRMFSAAPVSTRSSAMYDVLGRQLLPGEHIRSTCIAFRQSRNKVPVRTIKLR